MTVFIYTLADPRTDEVRYVGKTNDLKRRYSNHICSKVNTHTANWIRALKLEGLKPKLDLLEAVYSTKWEEAEIYWISQLKTWGFNLTNYLPGGGHDYITREIIPWNKGKSLSEDIKKKMSQSHKSLEHTWKIGKKQSLLTIEKRVSKLRGTRVISTTQVKELMESTETNIILAKKYNISLRGVYRIKARAICNS